MDSGEPRLDSGEAPNEDAGTQEPNDGGIEQIDANSDSGAFSDQDAGTDASNGGGGGGNLDAGDDGGVIIVHPPEGDAGAVPFLELECDTETMCPDTPNPANPAVTAETNLCYSPENTGEGTCTFYCTYKTVVDGQDVWVSPAGRAATCSFIGGKCTYIGENEYCLPKP
jgi:hypothetical protein